jgi:hypothetical protein
MNDENQIKKADIITFKNPFVKIGNPTNAMKYEIGARPEFNPFQLRIENGVWWVHTPDGERIPYVRTTNVYQNQRETPVCTFTAYTSNPGFTMLTMPTIMLKHGPAIVMPSGTEYPVQSFSPDINDEAAPVCTVVVPVVFVND